MAFPTIAVWIAFASVPFAAVPTWTDVSADVISFFIRRGRQHELDRLEAGTATVTLLNTSGNYWPSYSANVKPQKRLRIRATYNTISYDIFDGFIESYKPGFLLPPIRGAIMVLECVDLIASLSRLLLNSAGEAQELSGTRVGNILDDLAWLGGRLIDPGLSNIIATGALVNENAQEHLFLVQDSERGIVFVQGDGDVEFQDRGARVRTPYTTSQGIFGDSAGEFGYHRIEVVFENEYVYNDIRITREGGTEQTASDATSQTAYGKRSLSETGLLITTNTEALSQANYLLSRFKDPVLRAKNITIRPGADEVNLYPLALGLDISARITVRLSQANLNGDYHIEGISHNVVIAEQNWETIWELTSADNQIYWALGTVGFSELGQTTRLFY